MAMPLEQDYTQSLINSINTECENSGSVSEIDYTLMQTSGLIYGCGSGYVYGFGCGYGDPKGEGGGCGF